MKNVNLKKLNRHQQKEIIGAGSNLKCKHSDQCGTGACCSGGICILSPFNDCEPS